MLVYLLLGFFGTLYVKEVPHCPILLSLWLSKRWLKSHGNTVYKASSNSRLHECLQKNQFGVFQIKEGLNLQSCNTGLKFFANICVSHLLTKRFFSCVIAIKFDSTLCFDHYYYYYYYYYYNYYWLPLPLLLLLPLPLLLLLPLPLLRI